MNNKNFDKFTNQKNDMSAQVPKLRFPEFSEDWTSLSVSELYDFKGNNSLPRDKLNYDSGMFRNIHYGDIHTKFPLHFNVDAESVPYVNPGELHSSIRPENYCVPGDIIFADASEDTADIGKAIEIINTGDIPLLSGLHTILARTKEDTFTLGFGAYLFSSQDVRKQIQRESQGAKVLGISSSRLANVRLQYPVSKDEQLKITKCLSSVDELISAEAKKLEILKSHKNGLMQTLFPAEGQKEPKLRFPEFRRDGVWQENTLSQITTSIFDGTHQTPNYIDKGVPFFSVENIVSGKTNKFISKEDYLDATTKNRPEKGDVLITRIGNIGYSTVVDWSYEFSIYVTLAVIKKDDRFNSYYLHGYMQSPQYQAELRSKSLLNAVPCKINMDELRKTKVFLPSPTEQEKIAACFSSIDKLILEESKKIDSLKMIRKGLMQQLFPSMNEVLG